MPRRTEQQHTEANEMTERLRGLGREVQTLQGRTSPQVTTVSTAYTYQAFKVPSLSQTRGESGHCSSTDSEVRAEVAGLPFLFSSGLRSRSVQKSLTIQPTNNE
jgi:hypothetical protein